MKKQITILGTGNFAQSIGKMLANTDSKVVFASRNPKETEAKISATIKNAEVQSYEAAIPPASIVLIALPWYKNTALDILKEYAPLLKDKIVIDSTNALNEDFSPALRGASHSAAEAIQKVIPSAKVVKAFNTIFGASINPQNIAQVNTVLSVFYCGDDANANGEVGKLISEIGWKGIESGPLSNSIFMENMVNMGIYLAFVKGLGPNNYFGFKPY
ncbi:MAG: NAD(P)-binding domain-containing protein [Cytophagales bacterium]|jgi:predicted dinucleotide-binding enzyme|nr:NAD(P)-binding domain-containing protein [Cytophagales bacterium]MCA6366621.1 NAD(P)-binding domain-containing protein [Cytophagales bacterium]MCA6370032.1 NAD(P)-binding domain-containing protein [Cytophagales bacterium]MCA6375213.1 NAD(P)-binding domain-containing protein [Cytophagales bacterium]MCA6384268.1 NAD(P)-binding domain-containing protein [Cytophagales bacterium]